jgi:hypothetical protein
MAKRPRTDVTLDIARALRGHSTEKLAEVAQPNTQYPQEFQDAASLVLVERFGYTMRREMTQDRHADEMGGYPF